MTNVELLKLSKGIWKTTLLTKSPPNIYVAHLPLDSYNYHPTTPSSWPITSLSCFTHHYTPSCMDMLWTSQWDLLFAFHYWGLLLLRNYTFFLNSFHWGSLQIPWTTCQLSSHPDIPYKACLVSHKWGNLPQICLFLKDMWHETSIFTLYWLWGKTSNISPDLSHFLVWLPAWFWIDTMSPTFNGYNSLTCSFKTMPFDTCLLANAHSRCSLMSIHSINYRQMFPLLLNSFRPLWPQSLASI